MHMTELHEQDLTGARFERVNLRGSTFTRVFRSFIQTLRHLNFASAAWVSRMVLGNASPWHPLDLPWDEAPRWDGIPWDREAQPSLEDVLSVRRGRQASVRRVMASLTDEQLASFLARLPAVGD